MNLKEIMGDIPFKAVAGTLSVDVSGVVTDSRLARPGSLFVAFQGTQADGWRFASDAIERGAVAVVSECEAAFRSDRCFIQVPDARTAAGLCASRFHGRPSESMQVVGITGTNGKTTVSFMVRDILRSDGRHPGMIGTVHYEIGARVIPATRTTPGSAELQGLLADMRKAGCDSVVMEVSSHAVVQRRIAGTRFAVGVFTNLTHDHLDYHGSLDAYFAAKRKFMRDLPRESTVVVSADGERGAQLLADEQIAGRKLSFGLSPSADVSVRDLSITSRSSRCRVVSPWGEGDLTLPVPGGYNLSNATAAIGVGGTLGVPLDSMLDALAGMDSVPGRLEEVPTGKGFQVFVDYAHTDDALSNVLGALRELTTAKLWIVFGCGGDRDRAKRREMGAVADRLADRVIVTSDNPRGESPASIAEEICSGFGDGRNHETILDRREAIERAVSLAGDGDVILIAGKGHERFQEFQHTTVPFDDRSVVRGVLDGGNAQ